jgi:hypothetical protein
MLPQFALIGIEPAFNLRLFALAIDKAGRAFDRRDIEVIAQEKLLRFCGRERGFTF